MRDIIAKRTRNFSRSSPETDHYDNIIYNVYTRDDHLSSEVIKIICINAFPIIFARKRNNISAGHPLLVNCNTHAYALEKVYNHF